MYKFAAEREVAKEKQHQQQKQRNVRGSFEIGDLFAPPSVRTSNKKANENNVYK